MSEFRPDNTICDILLAEDGEPDWLVKDLMLQGSMVCLAGEPGAGKSYVSYTIALAIAAGCAGLGGLVPAGTPKRVVYFDEENSEGDRAKYLRRSWIGLKHSNGGVEPDLGNLLDNFWPVHFHLGSDDWVDRATEWVEFVQPHLIVVDTATPAFNITDENNNAEATQAIKALRRVMKLVEPTATAMVLKHAKIVAEKGGRRTMRGAKAWQGAADSVMFQVRGQGRPRKGGLQLTRLVPDKTRAYGLTDTIYITPTYTDLRKSGLALDGSYEPSREHKRKLEEDEGEEE